MPPAVSVAVETWPIAGAFVIARGAKTAAEVIVATVCDGPHRGRGECVPYARYGETVDGVVRQIEAFAPSLATREDLARHMPAGAARNALDCALWDLEAKRTGRSAFALAGLAPPPPCVACYTVSLAAPAAMAAAAAAAVARGHRLIKLKLGGEGDAERLRAVRAACPGTRLVADANEAWTQAMLAPLLDASARAGLELVEQPLPAGQDAALAEIAHPVPVCADESLHTRADLAALAARYDAVNVKLDKAGGLTEALALSAQAKALGLRVMVGCMVATSLAMAPAMLLAATADWIDLDGPLLLARDRDHGLDYSGGLVRPPAPELWG
ncbi:MAG: N-acetyl-D-Glu racemase DgcA [Hyphomicrobiaceae bacterium]|nr:N-acetyl-D-Glu racemase DgcA [Hyphomicrobiaceae bacterium]